MAYCRFSEGDVYLYHSSRGRMECVCCKLLEEANDKDETWVSGRQATHPLMFDELCEDAIEHLKNHVVAGHDVPGHAFDTLEEEKLKYSSTARRSCG